MVFPVHFEQAPVDVHDLSRFRVRGGIHKTFLIRQRPLGVDGASAARRVGDELVARVAKLAEHGAPGLRARGIDQTELRHRYTLRLLVHLGLDAGLEGLSALKARIGQLGRCP